MDLRGHSALVTGGAVRIGAAICRALAGAGCRVAVHYRQSQSAAHALAAELEATGVRAAAVPADLLRAGEADAVVDRAWDALGGVDILINNAALFRKGLLTATTADSLREELEVNFMAPVLAARRLVRRLDDERARGCGGTGAIVNLLDRRVAGVEAGCLPYLLSKKALADFTRASALEWAPHVRVNGVAPGAVLAPPGQGADYLREAAGFIPLQTRTTPEDVAAAVLFLLRSVNVTGQILYVDGGQHLCHTPAAPRPPDFATVKLTTVDSGMNTVKSCSGIRSES